jgi:hypothetical protein
LGFTKTLAGAASFQQLNGVKFPKVCNPSVAGAGVAAGEAAAGASTLLGLLACREQLAAAAAAAAARSGSSSSKMIDGHTICEALHLLFEVQPARTRPPRQLLHCNHSYEFIVLWWHPVMSIAAFVALNVAIAASSI